MGNNNACCSERPKSASNKAKAGNPDDKVVVGGRTIERRLLTFPRDKYVLKDTTRHLFKEYARLTQQPWIPTDDDIMDYIGAAYEEAMRVKPYVCIREMRFAEPRIATHPTFKQAVLGDENKSRVASLRLLDIGCCFGTDIRQAIVNGISPTNVFGVDIEREFVDSGIKMFADTTNFRKRFAIANVLEDGYEAKHRPLTDFVEHGVDLVYAGSVYHLLSEPQTAQFSAAIFSLLRNNPRKATFFGRTVGSNGLPLTSTQSQGGGMRFLHNADSLTANLIAAGFIDVKVTATEADWNVIVPGQKPPAALAANPTNSSGDANQTAMLSFTCTAPAKPL